MLKTLKVLSDLYTQDEQGNLVLIKENIITSNYIDIHDVTGPFEIINSRGVPYKTRCKIHHSSQGDMILKHRFEEVKEWVDITKGKNKNKIGFKIKKK